MAFKPGSPCHIRMSPNTSGGRRSSDIRFVVMHVTESPNPGAAGVASYFAANDTASAQLVVDDKECWRCVPDLKVCWGAASNGHGANERGLHIEQCGYTYWSRWRWLLHLRTIKRAAWHAAKWCRDYGIPVVWLSPSDLKAGKRGITSHNNISVAWDPGGHSDPGPGWPRDKFMYWVRRYRENMS